MRLYDTHYSKIILFNVQLLHLILSFMMLRLIVRQTCETKLHPFEIKKGS